MEALGIAAVAAGFERDLERSFAQVERLIARARGGGASLLVLPECALGGYLGPDAPPVIEADGPEVARLARLAGDMVVCAGFTERGLAGPYSGAVCVSGDGVLGTHRKVHVPASESGRFVPGDGFGAFDTPVGRIGMMLC